jgi:hypothetical protein
MDPLRQKMLVKTEHTSVAVSTARIESVDSRMNEAFQKLDEDGFNVSQLLVLPQGGIVVIGQRFSMPVADATPHGAPVAGSSAVQEVTITYSYSEGGEHKTRAFTDMRLAVAQARSDMDHDGRQPLGLHVASITHYGPGDLEALGARYSS